jgi:glutamyl-tRNA reductase
LSARPLPWVLAATAAETSSDERAAFAERAAGAAGGVLLGTCHRVELYGTGAVPELGAPILLVGEYAVRRLFRVAAGLESAVVGEDEILHQVREGLAAARVMGQVDPTLARLFERAIGTGRRARAGRRAPKTGLAERAVAWLATQVPIEGAEVLVAGTGVMGRALSRAAISAGATVLTASRDRARADLDLEEAALRAPSVSAVAVALSGPWQALEGVSGPLPPIVDLSSPPSVPASQRLSLGDRWRDIDELFEQSPVEADWLANAERLVAEGVAEFSDWLGGHEGTELIRALRDRSEDRRRSRVDRLLRRLPDLPDEQRQAVEQLSRQLVKDLLHEPLVVLRADADGSGGAAARRLFGL